MVTRLSASKAVRDRQRPLKAGEVRRKRARPAKRGNDSMSHVYGIPVPERLHEAIETERDNLSKAESLLACMVVSMEYQDDTVSGPYYPAVAQIARELVERSINGLDSLVLRQRLLRNKIEEAFLSSERAYPLLPTRFQGSSAHRLAA